MNQKKAKLLRRLFLSLPEIPKKERKVLYRTAKQKLNTKQALSRAGIHAWFLDMFVL